MTRPTGGLVAALGIVAVAAAAVALAGRWLATVPTISEDSDLSVPAVYSGEEQRFEVLEHEEAAGVPILCYHYFRPGLTPGRLLRVLGAVLLNMPTLPDKEFWTTTVPEFERQMRWLADHGYRTISLEDLVDHLEGRRDLPPRCVVLTIDDGDRSFVEHAVPVLRRHRFTATLFLLTGSAGVSGWNDLDVVDWETLRELEEEGIVRVESHTHEMHGKVERDGAWVPRFLAEPASVREDVEASRAAVRRHLGHDAQFLAWPFGYGSPEVDSLALAAGMRRVLTLRPERNRADTGAGRALGRYAVTARTSLRLFRLMVRPAAEES